MGDFVFNVQAYGALGDGATDDSTAIQAAITAAQSAGGGIVLIPPTTAGYTFSTGLAITPAASTLVGQSGTAANGVGGVARQALTSAGATGTRTFTLSGGDQGSNTMLAIPPAPPPANGSFFFKAAA